MCVVLEHLQLLSKRSSLGRGNVAGRGVEFRISPEGFDVIPLRQTGCWLCGNSYLYTLTETGGSPAQSMPFVQTKSLYTKWGGCPEPGFEEAVGWEEEGAGLLGRKKLQERVFVFLVVGRPF